MQALLSFPAPPPERPGEGLLAYRRLRRQGHKSEFWFLVCLRFPLASKHLDNIPLLGIPKGRRSWGARVAQWWEHSPPTNVARVQLPASTPYVGWVCCWFSPLLQKVFLRYSGFPLSSKTNTSKFQFDLGRMDTFKRVHMNSYVLRGLTNNLRFLLPTTLISPSYPGGYSRFSEWSRSDAILENEKTLGRGCINLL